MTVISNETANGLTIHTLVAANIVENYFLLVICYYSKCIC